MDVGHLIGKNSQWYDISHPAIFKMLELSNSVQSDDPRLDKLYTEIPANMPRTLSAVLPELNGLQMLFLGYNEERKL